MSGSHACSTVIIPALQNPCRISWVFCWCISPSLAQTTGRERGARFNMLPWKELCSYGRAYLRGQSNETPSPESFSIRVSAQHLTLVGDLAASGNSTSNPCSAMLQLMICLWLWWQQGLCDNAAVSRGYLPNCWTCSSLVFTEQAAFRAEEHLSMASSVLTKKTENFGIWTITMFSQLKSFLGITIATSVCNKLHIFVWLLDSSLADTNMNSPICCQTHAEWDLLLASPKWLAGLLQSGKKSGCVFHSLVNVWVRPLAGVPLDSVNWVLNTKQYWGKSSLLKPISKLQLGL